MARAGALGPRLQVPGQLDKGGDPVLDMGPAVVWTVQALKTHLSERFNLLRFKGLTTVQPSRLIHLSVPWKASGPWVPSEWF